MMAENKTETGTNNAGKSPNIKGCNTCRLVDICFLYRMAAEGINSFNSQANGIMEFPMKPEALAFRCPKYESPLDVIRKDEAAGV